MALERYAVFPSKGNETIGRRPAPPVAAAFLVAQFAWRRLGPLPVKRDRGEVEEACERLLVPAVVLGRFELTQDEGIAAEQEFVSLLLDFERGSLDRLTVPVDDLDHGIALAVFLDVALDALFRRRIAPQLAVRFRYLGVGTPGTGQKEKEGG
jgi:hypothetical protein